jgi:hypothetical protein
MWLRVAIPQESQSSALFEELGIPHDEDAETSDVFIKVTNLLCVASRVGEEEHCWICAADQQALPLMANFDELAQNLQQMMTVFHKARQAFPQFLQLRCLMPASAEEAELPNPPLFEHHILLNVDQVFHLSAPSTNPAMVSVGFGAPSLHYELVPESADLLRRTLGLQP